MENVFKFITPLITVKIKDKNYKDAQIEIIKLFRKATDLGIEFSDLYCIEYNNKNPTENDLKICYHSDLFQ